MDRNEEEKSVIEAAAELVAKWRRREAAMFRDGSDQSPAVATSICADELEETLGGRPKGKG